MHPSRVCEVPPQLGHQLLVRVDEHVDRAVADLERRDVREEVVPHEETHEHEVVDDPLKVVPARADGEVGGAELLVQVLAQHPDLEHLQLGRPDDGARHRLLPLLLLLLPIEDHLESVAINGNQWQSVVNQWQSGGLLYGFRSRTTSRRIQK